MKIVFKNYTFDLLHEIWNCKRKESLNSYRTSFNEYQIKRIVVSKFKLWFLTKLNLNKNETTTFTNPYIHNLLKLRHQVGRTSPRSYEETETYGCELKCDCEVCIPNGSNSRLEDSCLHFIFSFVSQRCLLCGTITCSVFWIICNVWICVNSLWIIKLSS